MTGQQQSSSAPARLRVDNWLWHARFFKSRTLAAKLGAGGGLRGNRQVVGKPHFTLQPGDVLTFPAGPHIRVVEVVALGERRGPAPEAQRLYRDLDPPRLHERRAEPPPGRDPGTGRPTKKQRRATDRLKTPVGWD